MIISSASPAEIVNWFHRGDHRHQLLCMTLAPSESDRSKLSSLIQNFFQADAALGPKIAFLLLHPNARQRLAIPGSMGKFAAFAGDSFSQRVEDESVAVTLRDTPVFRDVSDEGELYRAEIARESARAAARLVPDFMEVLGLTRTEMPAVCTLLRCKSDSYVRPLGANWKQADLLTHFAELKAIAERPMRAEPELPGLRDGRLHAVENGFRELAAKRERIKEMLDQIARRHRATADDLRRLAEYVTSDQLSQMALDSLMLKLSFSGNEKFSRDGQVAKVQELAGRVIELSETLQEMMSPEYIESLSEAAERMRLAREETAELLERLHRARLVSMDRDRVSILERARHFDPASI